MFVAALAGAAMLTGCAGTGFSTAAKPDGALALPAMTGSVHGGQQPISGATIKLYVAGSTGYGSAATYATGNDLLGNNTVTTTSSGSFSISSDYTCPSSSSLVYIVASGGNPGLTGTVNNAASVLVTALGACGNLNSNTYISINELTTAAAAFALGQFFTPTYGSGSADTFGAPASNLVGITNAFATAGNLVNSTTGLATTTTVPTTNANPNFFVTSNDQMKINTIGNILSDCVNQSSGSAAPCTSLFSAVTPSHPPMSSTGTATAASDTLQAAVYMSLNPTSTNSSTSATNMSTLIGLQSPYAAFAPSLAAAPTDWTLAVNYFNSNITELSSAAVDANGDVWFANQATSAGGIIELNGGTGTYGGTAGVAGTVIGAGGAFETAPVGVSSAVVQPNQPRVIAIDQTGHAWLADYSSNTADSKYYVIRATTGVGIDEAFPATGTCQWTTTGTPTEAPSALYAVAIDPSNNVIVGTSADLVLSLSATAASGTVPTTTCGAQGIEGSGTVHPGSTNISITPASVAYAPTNGSNYVFEFPTNPVAGYTADPIYSSATSFYGNALDANGTLWIADNSSSKLYTLTGSTFATAVTGGCLNAPRYFAVDGSDNIWVTSQGNSTNGAVCVYSNGGTLLSPSAGYGLHGYVDARGIAIDPSGNVWVTGYPNSTSTVTEIVGAAVPVVTPLAATVKNSTIGKRP